MHADSPLMLEAPRPSATLGMASFPVAVMLPDSSNVAVAIFSHTKGSLRFCVSPSDGLALPIFVLLPAQRQLDDAVH